MTTNSNYLNGFQCLYSADQENLNRKQKPLKKEQHRGKAWYQQCFRSQSFEANSTRHNAQIPGWKKWLMSGNLVQCLRHSRRIKSSQRIIFDRIRLTGTIGRPISKNNGSARSITLRPSLWPSTCHRQHNTTPNVIRGSWNMYCKTQFRPINAFSFKNSRPLIHNPSMYQTVAIAVNF